MVSLWVFHFTTQQEENIVNVVFCLNPAEDVMMETVVEVSTECGTIEEESFPIPPECEPAAKKKRGGQCQCSGSPYNNHMLFEP